MTHTVLAVETIENVHKELVNDIHDFIVVLIDGHLKIQSSELTQMPIDLNLDMDFTPEDWANLEHPLLVHMVSRAKKY
ncbi:MAG: hypothetical protein FRX49_07547 [Trebouxia sp. A1-2]|nr:MAG: hypothetical protein FRX49_13035 [Trebouxia sp. A1-2]KAA6422371.1 MAG: hypothetical protein FRX49_07547 [Trebouxia sp. A1-2]